MDFVPSEQSLTIKSKIHTHHKNGITSKFPELIDLDIPDGTVLDGEIIVTDNQGKPDFEAVMERFMSKKSGHQISYSVFEIIYYKGKKITQLPFLEFDKGKMSLGYCLLFENGEYAGLMEFMPLNNRKEFYRQYKEFIVKENDKFVYLNPKLRMKIKYRNLTKKGLLRIPSFVEWAN